MAQRRGRKGNALRIAIPETRISNFMVLQHKCNEIYGRSSELYGFKIASENVNRSRNLHLDILPFDSNLVTLPADECGKRKLSTYINASPIFRDKERTHLDYIAAQQPISSTINEFWFMIWHYQIKLVVMLINDVEQDTSYWAEAGKTQETAGGIEVKLTSESHNTAGHYVLRKFQLKDRVSGQSRGLEHWQFTSWTDHSAPDFKHFHPFFTDLRARMLSLNYSQPVLVHCRAGVGRTGTLIALDLLIRHQCASRGGVHSTVLDLRMFRQSMVYTESQLDFIYKYLEHALKRRLEE